MFALTSSLAYGSPLLGAILADGGWGRYRTILWFGVLYLLGLACLTGAGYASLTQETAHFEKSIETPAADKPFLARQLTFFGLFFACLGTGGIKPCVSAFGADQIALDTGDVAAENCSYSAVETRPDAAAVISASDFPEIVIDREQTEDPLDLSLEVRENATGTNPVGDKSETSRRVQEFFSVFYVGINIGALLAFVAIPMVRATWGFGAAFLIPTLFMTVALAVFWSQRKKYKHVTSSSSLAKMLRVCVILTRERIGQVFTRDDVNHSEADTSDRFTCNGHLGAQIMPDSYKRQDVPLDRTLTKFSIGNVNDQKEWKIYQDSLQCLNILPILSLLPMFWMLYDQQSSVWTFQASRMDLKGLEPEQLNVLNTIEIIIFVPVFERVIYPLLKEHWGWKVLPLCRMQWGMILASLAFVASGMLELYIQAQPEPKVVNVAWQIPQITILAMAEILLSVTGLEFAYAQAPSTAQALILAVYCFMTTLGDALGAFLYTSVFGAMNVASAMMICALLMVLNLFLFASVARAWKPYRRLGCDGLPSSNMDDEVLLQQQPLDHPTATLELSRFNRTQHID